MSTQKNNSYFTKSLNHVASAYPTIETVKQKLELKYPLTDDEREILAIENVKDILEEAQAIDLSPIDLSPIEDLTHTLACARKSQTESFTQLLNLGRKLSSAFNDVLDDEFNPCCPTSNKFEAIYEIQERICKGQDKMQALIYCFNGIISDSLQEDAICKSSALTPDPDPITLQMIESRLIGINNNQVHVNSMLLDLYNHLSGDQDEQPFSAHEEADLNLGIHGLVDAAKNIDINIQDTLTLIRALETLL